MDLTVLYRGQSNSMEVSSQPCSPQARQMKWCFHSSASYCCYYKKKNKKHFCAISYVSISPKRLYYPAFFQSFGLYFLLYL